LLAERPALVWTVTTKQKELQDYLMQNQILNQKRYEMKNFSIEDISRIIEMAWEDQTHFEAIEIQFGLKENDDR